MARVLHGMSIGALPEPGTIKDSDQMVAYDKDTGEAYRTDVGSLVMGDFLDKIYPVGSIYMSVNQIDPSTIFGGQWAQIKDCFLLAAGANHDGGETGGSETVSLTSSQIPSHTHSIPSLSGTAASAGSHSHTMPVTDAYEVGGGSAYRHIYTTGTLTLNTGSSGAHTHSVTTNESKTGSTGSGSAHDNMPPYMAVFMWQRIA